ncbi:polysaccharide deacetylase [Flavobacteriaceae bacterium LYZ1037]|nr:polysaccharide deacetylase [Flavobacteriaceae bacterium LYZ1037]
MKDVSTGCFILSLDFELHWGIFDKKNVADYEENLRNVKLVIPRLIELANAYNIKLTFATIGFLFAKNKEDLLNNNPKLLPSYSNKKFSPYSILNEIGKDETEDEYHYASRLIELISKSKNHEIATHTYSHYYCLEDGQTKEQFEADLIAAIAVATRRNTVIKSIIFPRNQVNEAYLDICKKHGLTSYRGTEKHSIYNTIDRKFNKKQSTRALRLIDSYINLTGHQTYKLNQVNKDTEILNIPSSRFLRPYSQSLKMFESLKTARVKNAMTYAAMHNEMYHLWWHPHNFGKNIDENFEIIESIFKHYNKLNETYNFNNLTMSEIADSN